MEGIQPFLVTLCFLSAWGLIILLAITLFTGVRDAWQRTRQMHAIPCPSCRFFTNDYRLKCPVQPVLANTEESIQCPDYRPMV